MTTEGRCRGAITVSGRVSVSTAERDRAKNRPVRAHGPAPDGRPSVIESAAEVVYSISRPSAGRGNPGRQLEHRAATEEPQAVADLRNRLCRRSPGRGR